MIKNVCNELFQTIANVVSKSYLLKLMTGEKVVVGKSQINAPIRSEFAESFIEGCDPTLDVSSIPKFLLIQFQSLHNKLIHCMSKQ